MRQTLFLALLGMAIGATALMDAGITWDNTEIDLGDVLKGKVISLEFDFTNESGSTVYITEAKGSCGCTSISYPSEGIAPGKSARISANFTGEKNGAFQKTITVRTSLSKDPVVLRFKGNVVQE